MNTFFVNLKPMLVAPLLTFLTNPLVNNDNTIVAKTTDDGLRDACSCAYLGKSRQMTDCINEVRAKSIMQLFRRDDHEGRSRILESLNSCNTLHRHFAQDGFLHRADAVVQTSAVLVYVLSTDR